MDREILGTEVVLPSKGLLYDNVPGGRVIVSPMTTREEKVVTGANPSQSASAADLLINRCCPSLSEMRPDELLIGDRLFLINIIRAVSYGKDYRFIVTCEICNQRFPHTVEIPDDLDVFYLADDFQEPFYVETPTSKTKFGLRLMRGKDERDITKYLTRIYEKAETIVGDPGASYRLAKHVVSVQGKDGMIIDGTTGDGFSKILTLIDQMYVSDTSAIRSAITNNDCGPDIELTIECPRCKNGFRMVMPYQTEFFRPGARRRN